MPTTGKGPVRVEPAAPGTEVSARHRPDGQNHCANLATEIVEAPAGIADLVVTLTPPTKHEPQQPASSPTMTNAPQTMRRVTVVGVVLDSEQPRFVLMLGSTSRIVVAGEYG